MYELRSIIGTYTFGFNLLIFFLNSYTIIFTCVLYRTDSISEFNYIIIFDVRHGKTWKMAYQYTDMSPR